MSNDPFAPFPRKAVADTRDPELPRDGLHPDMPFADYHALSAWGSSDLKTFRVGPPAMVPWRRENGSPDTDATKLGTACHARILTPDLFDATYVVKPEDAPDKPTAAMLNAKKPSPASVERVAWWAEFNRVNAGKDVLPRAMWDTVHSIENAVTLNSRAWLSIVESTHRESSILWTDPDTGEVCKARPDWYDEDWVYDLKVSRHAGPALAYRAYAEGWMHQSAHYRHGLRTLGIGARLGARLVVVNPKPPHLVYCVTVKDSALDVLTLENVNNLSKMRECRLANDWPGVPGEWTVIAPPDGAILETLGVIDMSGAEEVDGE